VARMLVLGAGEFPDIALHVITGDHPEGSVVDKHASRVTMSPGVSGTSCQSTPLTECPNVVAVGFGIAFQDPHPAIESGYVVVLARRPGALPALPPFNAVR